MAPVSSPEVANAYLDVVERALTFSLYGPTDGRIGWRGVPRPVSSRLGAVLDHFGLTVLRVRPRDPRIRDEGRDWPAFAQTMIGHRRLASLRACVEQLITDGIEGDLIEAGVWRGGASIMMRAVLKAHGCTDRTVVLADSFAGLPSPLGADSPEDRRVRWDRFTELAVSEAEVRSNFDRYGLLDDQVRFVRGWFRDTMPSLAGGRWSLVRLDGDTYTSTLDALNALYPGLAPGGYLIVDDYGPADTGHPAGTCRRAVDEFRASQGIDEPIQRIDWTGVLWRRASR